MATPKKRTGKASQATRRANWKGAIPATTICPNCKAVVLTHTVCPECGYYKNGFVSIKKKQEIEMAKPAKGTKSVAKVEAEPTVEENATTQKAPEKKTTKPRAKKTAAASNEAKKTTKPRAKKVKSEAETKTAKKTEE